MGRSLVPVSSVVLATVALVVTLAVSEPSHTLTTLAQELTSSPLPGSPADDSASGPEACQVTPRTREEFERIVTRPGVTLSASPILATPPAPPAGGTPADAAVVAGVSATVRPFIACTNAGDYLRIAALMSDQLLARSGRPAADVLANLATPVPLVPERQAKLEAITDVRVLDDGRVAAVVQVNGQRNGMIFVEVDGRYLLDDGFALAGEATPSP